LLGTGTSVGVPFIGCDCAVCQSPDRRNRRLRSSLWLRDERHSVLVDCGPDFRQQALTYGIRRLDAVLLTHQHADHILGLDDLRLLILRAKAPIPILGDAATLAAVRRVYAYAFDGIDTGSFKPHFDLHELPDYDQPIRVGELEMLPIPVHHGGLTVLGVRVGDFAYVPDCKEIPPASAERLAGLETLVIDGLRPKAHRTHFNIEEALAAIERLAPRQAWLTHLTHDIDATDESWLPAGVGLAFDGMVVGITTGRQ
jgi:phosphoribosyl 1,2-cyclic phosphate phosphodiesterase